MANGASDHLLRPSEAATVLGCSRSKVYSLIQAGRIPHVRIVGSVRVPEQALREWIATNTVPAA